MRIHTPSPCERAAGEGLLLNDDMIIWRDHLQPGGGEQEMSGQQDARASDHEKITYTRLRAGYKAKQCQKMRWLLKKSTYFL